MAQYVEALRCKSEACGFDSLWGYTDFFIYIALPSASKRNEYQGYLLGVKATGVKC